MHGFHIVAGVLAGSAGGNAKKVDHMLAYFKPGVAAQTDKETAHLGIACQMAEEVVRYGSPGIIATQPLIETCLLLWGGGRFRSPSSGHDVSKAHQRREQPRAEYLHKSWFSCFYLGPRKVRPGNQIGFRPSRPVRRLPDACFRQVRSSLRRPICLW